MTQILNADKESDGLIFEILSGRISEEPEDKKHVMYTLQVRFVSGNDDLTPSVIERRYTQFENLYNSLKKDFPAEMANVVFPKKVLIGNFVNDLISARSTAFESVLKHISHNSKLRTSRAMQIFLQEPELTEAKVLFKEQKFAEAVYKMESIFKLLNKVFSDRSHAVLLTLCRLVAYYSVESISLAVTTDILKWADLALYRFDGVSDSDLLELYVPLLYACITIYQAANKDAEELSAQLEIFLKKGMKDNKKPLSEVIDEVEQKIF